MRIAFLFPCLPVLAAVATTVAGEPPEPRFRPVNVDTNLQIGYGIALADVNGDRKTDILLADRDTVAWYRNPTWQRFVMAGKLTDKDHVCLAASDIDGDGRAEVAVGAEWNPGDTSNSGAVFYLVPPEDRTQRWDPVRLPHEPTVHRMRWVRDGGGRMGLLVVPLHGRGNQNGTGAGVRIQRYTPGPDPRQPWQIVTLDETLHKTHNFDPGPWDRDAADEFVVGSAEGLFLWNEVGGIAPTRLTLLATNTLGGIGEVRAGRLRREGAPADFVAAIEPMHGHALAVYRPPFVNAVDPHWTRQVLDESLIDGHALACGDLLGIGRDQIVVGWRAMNRPRNVKVGIKLFTPLDATGERWRTSLVDDNQMACEDLALADLDGDGRLDIVAAGRATRNLVAYYNETPR